MLFRSILMDDIRSGLVGVTVDAEPIVHHTPADWKSLIESRTEQLAQETVREIYLNCPICHLLYRIFGEKWLNSRIANSINSVDPFVLVDREALQGLYDDQNVTLTRNHVKES